MISKTAIRGRFLPFKGLLRRQFSATSLTNADFTHAIIGAGVVGLAIGAELAKDKNNSVVIIEKHSEYGTEVSSRNSEVIHAGLYFRSDSLRTKLCVEGKELIYAEGKGSGIDYRQCGKWVVAQDDAQVEYLHDLQKRSAANGVFTEFVPIEKAKKIEPLIHAKAILNSPTTGIVSAHSLMNHHFSKYQENEGELALETKVVGLSYDPNFQEYTIDTQTLDGEDMSITANKVINSAGLYAPDVYNLLAPKKTQYKAYYAKGSYFAYSGNTGISRLVYGCPTPGIASLGTHLTLDLGGQLRFGPDLEWVDDPTSFEVNGKNLNAAYEEVKLFFPSIELEKLSPTYAGIRPKISGPEDKTFHDFVIKEEEEFPGFINLLAIESPGLTASMAIGKYVKSLLD